MAERDTIPQIFICYAHKDNEDTDHSKRWLDRLLEHLAPLELQEQAEIWSDQRIELGEDWHDKIQKTLEQVKAAVLLISPAFLASRYVRNSELPVLLKRAKEQGLLILPILLRQCLWRETTFQYLDPQEGLQQLSLASLQMPTTQSLSELPEHQQDGVLYQVAQRLYQIVKVGDKAQRKPPKSVDISRNQPETLVPSWSNLGYWRCLVVNRENLVQANPETMRLSDRQELKASVGFFQIPKLKEIASDEPSLSYRGLFTLHRVLEEWRLTQPKEIRVLSSLTGAIIIVPDTSEIYIHQRLPEILEKCKQRGVPVRLGITHGDVEVLEDSDGLMNFIGTPVNVAARLAFSTQNNCLLYENTYTEFVSGLSTDKNNDPLHPRYCREINIKGKLHDPAFLCRISNANQLALNDINESYLLSSDVPPQPINAFVIAYDLPRFSAGDRSELSKRFRSVIDTLKNLKANNTFPEGSSFYFSPGGDGGILVFRGDSKKYINTALEFVALLAVESDNKDPNIDVKSRVGLHYGVVNLYRNAEGIERPTGLICFIADEIASDKLAKKRVGIVITEPIKGLLFAGSETRFQQEYESLESLKNGVAKNLKRYVKRKFVSGEDKSENPATTTEAEQVPTVVVPVEVNYEFLNDLLLTQRWQEADQETVRILREINEGWLRPQDIREFPCSVLIEINKLWVNYSQDKFGFSVQKRIWLQVGGQSGQYSFRVFRKFGERVGWCVNDDWLKYDQFTFTLLEAPAGHLPSLRLLKAERENNWWGAWERNFREFLSRTEICLSSC